MFKLDLEKAEEPEIKFPASTGSQIKQENCRKTPTSASSNLQKPLTVWIKTNCGKLTETGISDHIICFLRNLNAGREVTARTEHGTADWFQTRKGVSKGCILLPCLLKLYAQYIMQNAGLDEAQAGIKIARKKYQ